MDVPISKQSQSQEKTGGRMPATQGWHPFESLHREIDRVFDQFGRGLWSAPFRRSVFDIEPFWRGDIGLAGPAVDIVEKDRAYEVTVEIPGVDEKNLEVKLVNGGLTIKGEKREEKEEKKKDYYVHERNFGSFERSFSLPEDVDSDKIEASFKKGVLSVVLPKKPEAQKPEKKIDVKPA